MTTERVNATVERFGGSGPHAGRSIVTLPAPHPSGATSQPAAPGRYALLLLHGRGSSARDILGLGTELLARLQRDEDAETSPSAGDSRATAGPGAAGRAGASNFSLCAPDAANGSWYPGSFLEPLERNQPWLDSALELVASSSRLLEERGIPRQRQVLVGFSQGACLASEFLARHAQSWGGLLAFTGGVLGPLGEQRSFSGDLEGTPILLSSGDPDPHVPFQRVRETAALFESLGAEVTVDRYANRPHTISEPEVVRAVSLLGSLADGSAPRGR